MDSKFSKHFILPEDVLFILNTYKNSGYDAYIVGGCVRDLLLEKEPTDWDICTSALPEQSIELFKDFPVQTIGIKHGTISLSLNEKFYEITTFRKEGLYSDNRHPDKVEFVDDIKDDLARRDFTINAMAYKLGVGSWEWGVGSGELGVGSGELGVGSGELGVGSGELGVGSWEWGVGCGELVDLFGGLDDLKNKIIKCVGDPKKRFTEDALRIVRALRFASTLDFAIEKETEKALFDCKNLLPEISRERINVELNKMLLGENIHLLLQKYIDIISEIVPELNNLAALQVEQNNPYHIYDVLTHTIYSVFHAKNDLIIRLVMLFHDLGKIDCKTTKNGIDHFYGHREISAVKSETIMKRLKYDNQTITVVTELILYHDLRLKADKKHIKKWLNKIGEMKFRQLLDVQYADTMAKSDLAKQEKLPVLKEIAHLLEEIKNSEECFRLKDLDINGKDLILHGIPEGKEIGQILNYLLLSVIEGKVINEKMELLKYVNS